MTDQLVNDNHKQYKETYLPKDEDEITELQKYPYLMKTKRLLMRINPSKYKITYLDKSQNRIDYLKTWIDVPILEKQLLLQSLRNYNNKSDFDTLLNYKEMENYFKSDNKLVVQQKITTIAQDDRNRIIYQKVFYLTKMANASVGIVDYHDVSGLIKEIANILVMDARYSYKAEILSGKLCVLPFNIYGKIIYMIITQFTWSNLLLFLKAVQKWLIDPSVILYVDTYVQQLRYK